MFISVPVLSLGEAARLDPTSSLRPAPHPHLSRTPPSPRSTGSSKILKPGTHTEEILAELSLSAAERKRLAYEGALGKEIREQAMSKQKL